MTRTESLNACGRWEPRGARRGDSSCYLLRKELPILSALPALWTSSEVFPVSTPLFSSDSDVLTQED